MLESYEKIIVNLRESIAKTTCDKYIFHLPIITAFKNSFFQSAETVEELKDLFFKTLFIDSQINSISSYFFDGIFTIFELPEIKPKIKE